MDPSKSLDLQKLSCERQFGMRESFTKALLTKKIELLLGEMMMDTKKTHSSADECLLFKRLLGPTGMYKHLTSC